MYDLRRIAHLLMMVKTGLVSLSRLIRSHLGTYVLFTNPRLIEFYTATRAPTEVNVVPVPGTTFEVPGIELDLSLWLDQT